MSLSKFYLIYSVALGVLVGSFLNVVILRLPPYLMWKWKRDAHEFIGTSFDEPQPPGIVFKRSFCPNCQRQLGWQENIPLLSFIFLKGRCKTCSNPISYQYPLIEMAMGVLSYCSVLYFGWSFSALIAAGLCAVLLVCAAVDFKTQLLPDDIVLPSLWVGLLCSLTPFGFVSPHQSLLGSVLGYMSLWSLFWLFKIITKKEGMGHGDFKLLGLLGAYFGPTALIPILLIACGLGSVVGIVFLKIKNQSQPFAFGPYLAAGGIMYLFAGDWITHFIF